VPPVEQLVTALRTTIDEWAGTAWDDLTFADAGRALLVCVVLVAVAVLALLVQIMRRRKAGRTHIVLPALLPGMRPSPFAMLRHLPVVLFAAGVPFFAVALAGPQSGFMREEVSQPGRRIAILVDASTSMVMAFKTTQMKTQGDATFFAAVSAAELFVKRRMDGPYRDLLALIQFGNEAYVVTPFTNDYENVRLSLSLVSDPREWGRFSDWGTTIIEGIDRGIELFKTFQFINASGNLMVVFTDGRDSELNRQARPLERLVFEARQYKIPVHMVRTAFGRREGDILQDSTWRTMVERTGGRFYAVHDEDSLLRALVQIDRLAPGRIDTKHYTVSQPRYAGYVLIALLLWLSAAVLKTGFGMFRTFP
jgi:von Willebrand factor type A domain